VLSTFSLGTLITFGCALMYSVHQPGASIRAASRPLITVEAGHSENGSFSGKLATDARNKSTHEETSPARKSAPDPTTPGSAQSAHERPESELWGPWTRAVPNTILQSSSSNMAPPAQGDSLAPGLSPPITVPEVEITSHATEQRLQPASTVGTAGPVKTEATQQPAVVPKSPGVPVFAPEEKAAAPSPEHGVATTTLDRGTSVEVRLAGALSSDHNRTGDSFEAVLATPLVANGTVVAGEGSTVFGRIADVHKARLLRGRSWLTLTLANIKLPDGRLVQINTTRVQRSLVENPILATTKIIRGAALGSVKGAFNGAARGAGLAPNTLRDTPENSTSKGRAAMLPAGTEISFNLTAPITLTTTANR